MKLVIGILGSTGQRDDDWVDQRGELEPESQHHPDDDQDLLAELHASSPFTKAKPPSAWKGTELAAKMCKSKPTNSAGVPRGLILVASGRSVRMTDYSSAILRVQRGPAAVVQGSGGVFTIVY